MPARRPRACRAKTRARQAALDRISERESSYNVLKDQRNTLKKDNVCGYNLLTAHVYHHTLERIFRECCGHHVRKQSRHSRLMRNASELDIKDLMEVVSVKRVGRAHESEPSLPSALAGSVLSTAPDSGCAAVHPSTSSSAGSSASACSAGPMGFNGCPGAPTSTGTTPCEGVCATDGASTPVLDHGSKSADEKQEDGPE